MTKTRITQALLLVMAALFVAGEFVDFHDIYTLAFLVAAAGIALTAAGRTGWVVAAAFAGIALFWSARDQGGCSFWWRGHALVDKSVGRLPYISWDDVRAFAFSSEHCFFPESEHQWIAEAIVKIDSDEIDGHPFAQFETPRGKFWIGDEDKGSLVWLLWEINEYETYQGHEDTILPGDTVIDCGAHVGVYTRYALERGAARVISIEPDPVNIAALERNFAEEIEAGTVVLVKAGVWAEEDSLTLSRHEHETTRPTLFTMEGISETISVPVRPLDDIVEELGVERVDFIKMDIEGAERNALEGAQRTIARFRPRMAICAYHMVDDPEAIPLVALAANPDYRIHAKEISVGYRESHPKVLFFN